MKWTFYHKGANNCIKEAGLSIRPRFIWRIKCSTFIHSKVVLSRVSAGSGLKCAIRACSLSNFVTIFDKETALQQKYTLPNSCAFNIPFRAALYITISCDWYKCVDRLPIRNASSQSCVTIYQKHVFLQDITRMRYTFIQPDLECSSWLVMKCGPKNSILLLYLNNKRHMSSRLGRLRPNDQCTLEPWRMCCQILNWICAIVINLVAVAPEFHNSRPCFLVTVVHLSTQFRAAQDELDTT